ncbi:hypothetical protein R2G56_07715 [Nitratireductor aquimarinus]|uniref:Uncharacterized protein n=1 Tax=Nitratireductor aquimarinus TaxID=889300 RepID=A0ABU4AIT5_9HYPH|nr:hypothetical protein [Nitratireductor aquimarinus]MDV6226171.1 hypothetical protein [Nitratireductor aquimarinus]
MAAALKSEAHSLPNGFFFLISKQFIAPLSIEPVVGFSSNRLPCARIVMRRDSQPRTGERLFSDFSDLTQIHSRVGQANRQSVIPCRPVRAGASADRRRVDSVDTRRNVALFGGLHQINEGKDRDRRRRQKQGSAKQKGY